MTCRANNAAGQSADRHLKLLRPEEEPTSPARDVHGAASVDDLIALGRERAGERHRGIELRPVLIEERLEATVADGIILSGQADLVCTEPGQIRDLKTGARNPPSAAPQVGGYALLARSHELPIETAAIDFIRRVAPDKPQPDPVSVTVELQHAEVAAVAILDRIIHAVETFRHGDPEARIEPGNPWSFTANPNSILCGEKWCPAYGVAGPHAFCHEWAPK